MGGGRVSATTGGWDRATTLDTGLGAHLAKGTPGGGDLGVTLLLDAGLANLAVEIAIHAHPATS